MGLWVKICKWANLQMCKSLYAGFGVGRGAVLLKKCSLLAGGQVYYTVITVNIAVTGCFSVIYELNLRGRTGRRYNL